MKNARFDSEREADKSRPAKADGDARTAGLIHLKPGRISSDKCLEKEVHMHRLIKAMTVAGMIAGLPLTEAANAQTPWTWYQFTASACDATVYTTSNGTVVSYLQIQVFLNGVATWIYVPNSPIISALYSQCTDGGTGFYAMADGGGNWTSFYTWPGLR